MNESDKTSSTSSNAVNLTKSCQYWDNEAEKFDDEPDHGLRDLQVQMAWTELLQQHLPLAPASVLDVGCGTGSLSVLLAGLGYRVTGVDLSPAMIAQAKKKANLAGRSIQFEAMDAFVPQLLSQQFDVVLCRHLLWMSPEPAVTLRRWAGLLRGNGRLLLIEGYWQGGGLHAPQILAALPTTFNSTMQNLSQNPLLWGRIVSDERYIVIASTVI